MIFKTCHEFGFETQNSPSVTISKGITRFSETISQTNVPKHMLCVTHCYTCINSDSTQPQGTYSCSILEIKNCSTKIKTTLTWSYRPQVTLLRKISYFKNKYTREFPRWHVPMVKDLACLCSTAIWSLARHNELRIWGCHSCGTGCRGSSDSIPDTQGTSIFCGWSPKCEEEKKKRKKNHTDYIHKGRGHHKNQWHCIVSPERLRNKHFNISHVSVIKTKQKLHIKEFTASCYHQKALFIKNTYISETA